MKKFSLIALSAVAALSTTSAFAVGAGSMYAGLSVGCGAIAGKTKAGAYVATEIGKWPAITEATLINSKKSTGAIITPSFGYQITDNFRSDLSFQYLVSQNTTYVNYTFARKLTRKGWMALANFYYDFTNASSFVPYVGANVGYGSFSFENTKLLNAAGTSMFTDAGVVGLKKGIKGKKSTFVYGATLGAGYKVNSNTTIDLSYTINVLPKVKTKLPTVTATTPAVGDAAIIYKSNSLMHAINLGVRFGF